MTRSSRQGADGQTLVLLMAPKEQSRGESSTPNISEWPNDAAVCSLSQVLEQISIPQRFFLSSKACAGILRRAEKRGKQLPPQLQAALTAVAQTGQAEMSIALNPSKSVCASTRGGMGRLDAESETLLPIALQDVTPREKAQNGKGWNDDGVSYTVDAAATQGVMQSIATHDVAGTMLSRNTSGGFSSSIDHAAAGYMAMQSVAVADVGPTMGSSGPPYSRTGNERVETEALAIHAMQVRRLTPVECERLQGFPDNYTNIKDKCPDGPRYKALGNSWAVPVVRWIGERIGRALD